MRARRAPDCGNRGSDPDIEPYSGGVRSPTQTVHLTYGPALTEVCARSHACMYAESLTSFPSRGHVAVVVVSLRVVIVVIFIFHKFVCYYLRPFLLFLYIDNYYLQGDYLVPTKILITPFVT